MKSKFSLVLLSLFLISNISKASNEIKDGVIDDFKKIGSVVSLEGDSNKRGPSGLGIQSGRASSLSFEYTGEEYGSSKAIYVKDGASQESPSTNRLDVDKDNRISPLDVLMLINALNRGDQYNIDLDANSDGYVSPIDVLLIINYLNRDPATNQGGTYTGNNRVSDTTDSSFSLANYGRGQSKASVSYNTQAKKELLTGYTGFSLKIKFNGLEAYSTNDPEIKIGLTTRDERGYIAGSSVCSTKIETVMAESGRARINKNAKVEIPFANCVKGANASSAADLKNISEIGLSLINKDFLSEFSVQEFSLTGKIEVMGPEDIYTPNATNIPLLPTRRIQCDVIDLAEMERKTNEELENYMRVHGGKVDFEGETSCFRNPYFDASLGNGTNVYVPPAQFGELLNMYTGDNANYNNSIEQSKSYWINSNANNAAVKSACFICLLRRDSGCYPRGVQVSLANGDSKKVEDIAVGDLISNPVTGEARKVLKIVEGPEKLGIVEYGFGDTLAKVTQKHPILTKNGLKTAIELSLSDEVKDKEGKLHQLRHLKVLEVQEGETVINFVLEGENKDDHYMLADGIVVGDLYLQKELGK